MEFREITQYALYFGGAMFVLVVLFAIREMTRRAYRKAATDKNGREKILLEVIASDDKTHTSWATIDGLFLKDEKSNNQYPIVNIRFIRTRYPESGMFANLGVSVQKAIVIEGSEIPVLKKDEEAEPTNITSMVGLARNEMFLAVVNSAVKQLQGAFDPKAGTLNNIIVYSLLGLGILSQAGVLYVLIYIVIPWMDKISAGLGV